MSRACMNLRHSKSSLTAERPAAVERRNWKSEGLLKNRATHSASRKERATRM